MRSSWMTNLSVSWVVLHVGPELVDGDRAAIVSPVEEHHQHQDKRENKDPPQQRPAETVRHLRGVGRLGLSGILLMS